MLQIKYHKISPELTQASWGSATVVVRRCDGFINGTDLAQDAGKSYRVWSKLEWVRELTKRIAAEIDQDWQSCFVIDDYQGSSVVYLHPAMVTHLGAWCSPDHLALVSELVQLYRSHQSLGSPIANDPFEDHPFGDDGEMQIVEIRWGDRVLKVPHCRVWEGEDEKSLARIGDLYHRDDRDYRNEGVVIRTKYQFTELATEIDDYGALPDCFWLEQGWHPLYWYHDDHDEPHLEGIDHNTYVWLRPSDDNRAQLIRDLKLRTDAEDGTKVLSSRYRGKGWKALVLFQSEDVAECREALSQELISAQVELYGKHAISLII